MRSVRHAARSRSRATRYHRRAVVTTRYGIEHALRLPSLAVAVAHAQPLAVAARAGQRHQHVGWDGGGRGAEAGGHRGDRGDLPAHRRREELLELAERPDRRIPASGDRLRRGRAQAHGDGDGLLAVEHQRRHRRPAGTEAVAAGDAGVGLDRVAELPEPVDVAAHGPHRDAEPVGQLRPGPLRPRLEEGEHAEQSSGRRGHGDHSRANADRNGPHSVRTVDAMDIDWTHELVEQFDWHWTHHLRPRLDGLTDDEYLWEPDPGCLERPAAGRGDRAAWPPAPARR